MALATKSRVGVGHPCSPRHTHPEQWEQRFIAFLSDALAIDGGQESS
jgi:hypothetical protein